MENKLDSLFKKKLENNSLVPREDAWARVESNLSKKNKFSVWRIAAAILIAGALITAGVFTFRKTDAPVLVKKSDEIKSKPSTEQKESISRKDAKAQRKTLEKPNLSTLAQAREKKSEVAGEEFQQQKETILRKDAETQGVSKVSEPLRTFAPSRENLSEVVVVEQNLKPEATTLVQTTSTPIEKPIKLEFTLEEVVADQTAVAKTETKNSGLKKMWETARQIKNGEGPMNQLLEKKDELFALNFKKEKQKTQH